MGANDEQDQDPKPGGAAATLGDVLYADGSTALVSESVWVEWVRCIAAGDLRGLHALYERTHRIVFTLIVRMVGSHETAEEVTLDVFHDAWRRAGTYDPANGTVLGWVMNQARSRAIDRLRFDQRKKRVDPHPTDAGTATSESPHDMLELRQQARLLHDALGGLTVHERQAIEAAYFSELTYAETAARLNEPLGTVKTRIRTGLQKLRKSMTEGSER